MKTTKTDLNELKNIAISFLHIKPEPTGDFGNLFVTHPYTNTSTLFMPKTNELFNLFDDCDKFIEWKKYMENFINTRKDAFSIFSLINNPYKLTFFKFANHCLSKKEYSQLLIYCYTQVEFIADNVNYTKKDIVKWFKKADKQYLMEKEDMEVYTSLPDVVSIYRGCRDAAYKYELSWTLDKNRAIWFAKRFGTDTQIVLETKINKSDILCFTDICNEKEVIINPDALNKENIKEKTL